MEGLNLSPSQSEIYRLPPETAVRSPEEGASISRRRSSCIDLGHSHAQYFDGTYAQPGDCLPDGSPSGSGNAARSNPMREPVLKAFIDTYRYIVIFFQIIRFIYRVNYEFGRSFYHLFFKKKKQRLYRKTVLVTGAATGTGREICMEVVRQIRNAVVVCVDIDETENNETVNRIRAAGGVAYGYVCDIGDEDAVNKLVELVHFDVGGVNMIINNAGTRIVRPLLQQRMEQIGQQIWTTLVGQIIVTRAFLPYMTAAQKGTIVGLSAAHGYGAFPNMIPFVASKFGIRGFMEGLYLELRQHYPDGDFHVMTASPFIVDTGKIKGTIINFPFLKNLVTAPEAAEVIVDSICRRETVILIPGIYYYIFMALRILPLKVQLYLVDWLDTAFAIGYDSYAEVP